MSASKMIPQTMSEYLNCLLCECEKFTLLSTESELHTTLKNIYRIIKQCSSINVSNASLVQDENFQTTFSVIRSLLLLLTNENHPADVILLCGTCLTLLIANIFDPKFTSSFLLFLYCYFDEKYSGNQNAFLLSKEVLEKKILDDIKCFLLENNVYIPLALQKYEEYLINIDSKNCSMKTPSFQQIAILNGIASCQMPELYTFHLQFSSQQKPFLISIFTPIHQCCLSPSVHQYHSFHILLNWLRMCEICLNTLVENGNMFFHSDSYIVQNILSLLEANWQSPIKGTNAFIKEMYRLLIKLNEKEMNVQHLHDMNLVDYLLSKTMILSWQVKGKFFLLSVILQFIDYSKFFKENPDAPSKIMFSLKANYIASSVAEVYKIVVTSMKQLYSGDDLSSEWSKLWLEPLLNCLHSNDRLLIQNVTNNILPWTMKQFPKSYELLMDKEDKSSDDSVKLLLLRIAKGNLPYTLGDKELILINNNLHHNSIQKRTEILSILCSSPKKSEAVNSKELDYIKDFIEENLNIDSAPYHQHLLAQLHTLLVRIRDSVAQDHRSKVQANSSPIDLSQIEFVNWLAYAAIQNTFPGACFQRRRLSLQILGKIYDVFIESPMGYKRKEKPSKSIELVIKWAQANNLWLFFRDDTLMYILPCVTDFADEIRSLSANLLQSYSSWPFIDNCEAIPESPAIKYALSLCNHPDFRNNDGGAHICSIIFHRLCNQSNTANCHQDFEFLKHLVSIAKLQLESAKEDIVLAAMRKPIHGMLLALQYCFASGTGFLVKASMEHKSEIIDIIKNSVYLCFDAINYMLSVMKGEKENYYCPSFSDIGKALETLVLSKKDDLLITGTEDLETINGDISDKDCCDYTSLCDLLLSCCWHSIKNSCFLLCELSTSVLSVNINNSERRKILIDISEELSSILIACRHRGVVEACCEALYKFCVNLLKDKALYEDITMGLLKSVFSSLNDAGMVSVTRRSAGLPLLFQAVVSSEDNNISRHLLSFSIENLLNLINQPLPSPESISDKTDLPQAHAFHILKALVSDARLSQSILPHFDSIIPICITGFSSTIWTIRNGALQLFGVILPRVCGQKKVRDDDSEHNMVSAFELFARCPSLKTYLLQELIKCVKFHKEKRLCSEFIPILSLLVKLMPEQEDQRIFMMDFTPLLLEFLNNPVWKVRDLTSSALSLLMQDSEIISLLGEIVKLFKNSSICCNQIHSMLLIVQKFMKRRQDNILLNFLYIENNLKNIYSLMQENTNCPLLVGLTVEMMMLVSDAKKDTTILNFIYAPDMIDSSRNKEVGLLFYETKSVLVGLRTSTPADLPMYIKKLVSKNKQIQIICLQFLSEKLKFDRSTEFFYSRDSLNHWKEIFVSVLAFISPDMHPSVIKEALQFMISLCSDWNAGKVILNSCLASTIDCVMHDLDVEAGLSVSALSFTMWSICLRAVLEMQDTGLELHLERWNLLLSTYCQPRTSDILRFQAARSLAITGPALANYLVSNIGTGSDVSVQILTDMCEGCLLLLQDEDEDIRNEACKFPSYIHLNYSANVIQFNAGIKVISQYMFNKLQSEPLYLMYLWNRLQNFPSTAKILQSYSGFKRVNLFEQEYVNVFAEPRQILMYHHSNFKAVLTVLFNKNYKLYHEKIDMFLQDLEVETQDVLLVLSSTASKNDQSFTYHHQVFLALKKLHCQVDLLMDQKKVIMDEDPLQNKFVALNKKWESVEKLLPTVTCWFLNIM